MFASRQAFKKENQSSASLINSTSLLYRKSPHLISQSRHCSDQIPDKNHLKEERVVSAHSSGEETQSITVGKADSGPGW